MSQLKIEFMRTDEVPAGLQQRIDALDHLAFSSDAGEHEPEDGIQWAPDAEWIELGWLDEELASQLYLHRREIIAGTERFYVAGVGGVATHPQRQKQGLGTQLMRAAETFMREKMGVPFGLLVCDYSTCPFYEKNGWETAADRLVYTQENERRIMETCVMVQRLAGDPWPAGEIDLQGLPW